jgi:stage V sporulation protein R
MMEFHVRHTQVLRPSRGSINPYHFGYNLWHDIEKRWDKPSKDDLEKYGERSFKKTDGTKKTGRDKIFEVREVERDTSFIRRYLTQELMRELDIVEYEKSPDGTVRAKEVPDDDNWERIRDKMIEGVGMGSVPVIKVEDANFGKEKNILLLKHYFEGRNLHPEYTENTLKHIMALWKGKVCLESVSKEGDKETPIRCFVDENGKFKAVNKN